MKNLIQLIAFLLFFSGFSQSILDKKLEKFEGFFDFYYDASTDKIYLEVENLDSDFLYINSLATGIGSNDIGLDRGQLGNERLVSFQKAGNKLLLIQPNLSFRAITTNNAEENSIYHLEQSLQIKQKKIVLEKLLLNLLFMVLKS